MHYHHQTVDCLFRECHINYPVQKAGNSSTIGHAYFAEILPNYDRDRVHNGDIKKLISWYNLLVNNGITEFVEAPAESADKVEEAAAE